MGVWGGEEGERRQGYCLIRGPEGVGAGGGSAGPSSLPKCWAPPPPRAPRYTHTQRRPAMHTQRRLRARVHAGSDTHLSPCTGLLSPRERRLAAWAGKGPTVLQERGNWEQPQRGPAK